MSNEKKIKVLPLGGVETVGMNCTVIEYNGHILIVDCGMGFSEDDHLGVDYLIPNYDYLKKNKEKIEGIFVTHGHLDHIGAIAHFLPEIGFPNVFAPRFAIELIKNRLEEANLLQKMQNKIYEVNSNSVLENEEITIEYFRVTHSIPDSYGIVIKTPEGNIAISGDFKFDNSPLNEPKSDYYKLAKYGEKGIKLLLSDSTNAIKSGHSISEYDIKAELHKVIQRAKGRVIVATFSSLVTRLYALIEIAKAEKRKVFITGRSMHTSIEIARKLGYINAPDSLFIYRNKIKRFSDKRVMVLATGSQGEHMAALSRMARNEHRDINLKKGDTVIFSSSVIPGNDLMVQNLTDEISSLGAEIINNEMMDVHTSGHGFAEDQKLMLSLLNPEFFMPIHGIKYFLKKHKEIAQKVGIKKNNIIIPEKGRFVEIGNNSFQMGQTVKHHPLLISGSSVGDVGPLVLRDREKLAENGVVVITILVNSLKNNKKKLYKDPDVFSRGFVYVKENKQLIDRIVKEVRNVFDQNKNNSKKFRSQLRSEIESRIQKMLYKETQREPLIVINIELIK